MQQFGVVVDVQGEDAIVRFVRTKACAHCGGCISFGENEAQVTLKNTLDAKAGDCVRVELHAKSVLEASLLVYILPLCLLLLGVAFGSRISDLAGILLGLLGAGSVYVALRLLEPRISRMTKFHPRMISIEPNEDIQGGNEHV